MRVLICAHCEYFERGRASSDARDAPGSDSLRGRFRPKVRFALFVLACADCAARRRGAEGRPAVWLASMDRLGGRIKARRLPQVGRLWCAELREKLGLCAWQACSARSVRGRCALLPRAIAAPRRRTCGAVKAPRPPQAGRLWNVALCAARTAMEYRTAMATRFVETQTHGRLLSRGGNWAQ